VREPVSPILAAGFATMDWVARRAVPATWQLCSRTGVRHVESAPGWKIDCQPDQQEHNAECLNKTKRSNRRQDQLIKNQGDLF